MKFDCKAEGCFRGIQPMKNGRLFSFMRAVVLVFVAATLIFCFMSYQEGTLSKKAGEMNVTSLGTSYLLSGISWGPYRDVSSVRFNSDGTRWGFMFNDAGNCYAIIDGNSNGPYKHAGVVNYDQIWLSKTGNGWYDIIDMPPANGLPQTLIIVNGKEYGPFQQLTNRSTLYMSDDGKHWTFGSKNLDGTFSIFVDGVEYGPYETINSEVPVVFSPDYSSWIAGGKLKKGGQELLVSGKSSGVFVSVGDPIFTADSRHWLADGLRIRNDKIVQCVVLDGTVYDGWAPRYSYLEKTTGKTFSFAWLAETNGKIVENHLDYGELTATELADVIYVGGEKKYKINGVTYSAGTNGSQLVFGAGGKQWGFVSATGKSCTVWVTGQKFGPYTCASGFLPSPPVFSNTGDGWWFSFQTDPVPVAGTGKTAGNSWLVINGKQFGPYVDISEHFPMSSNGKKWVFCAVSNDGNYVIRLADNEYTGLSGIQDPFEPVSVSDEFHHYGFSALKKDSDWFVIIDGKQVSSGYYVSLGRVWFTSSGESWGYSGRKKFGKDSVDIIVLNGYEQYGENLGYSWDISTKGKREYFFWTSYAGKMIYFNQYFCH